MQHRHISVVLVRDGAEHDLTPAAGISRPKESSMSQPSISRLPRVQNRVAHLLTLTQRAREFCGHWDPENEVDCTAAISCLSRLLQRIQALPAGYVPPRKPTTRCFMRLDVGDSAVLAKAHAAKAVPCLRGKVLTIAAVLDGGFVDVRIEDSERLYPVARAHLAPVQ